MTARWRLAAVCAVGTLAVCGAFVRAQGVPPQPSQTPLSPLAASRKAVADAQAAVYAVRANIAQIHARVASTFESRDDWIAAKKALSDAQAHYDSALKPVMAALQVNPDYQKLATSRKAAQAKLEELKSEPRAASSEDQKAQDDQLSEAAGEVLNDGFAMNKMESDARDADGNLGTAKEELADAKKAMDALQAQVTAVLQVDPEYIAAQQQLTTAQQQLTAARAALVSAEKPQRSAPTPRSRTPSSRNPGS